MHFFPPALHSFWLTYPGFNVQRWGTLVKPCFDTVKVTNHRKERNKCFSYARVVQEANWCHQHKWWSCHPWSEFQKHKPFHHLPPSEKASVLVMGPGSAFCSEAFAALSEQFVPVEMLGWDEHGALRLRTWSYRHHSHSSLCHQHGEDCITRSWFWFFPSVLSKAFSVHDTGWVQTLLLLSVQELPVTSSWLRSAQSSRKAVCILSLENKNQYSIEFYFILFSRF